MSFVDLATLALHRRHEIEARTKIFLEKCDIAIQDIEKLKSQACGFVDCLNCDPSELKERFLNSMRHLDEYTYLLTDFNLSVGRLDLPNNMTNTLPVQDQVHIPLMTPTVGGGYNLMDALSEPIPSTSKRCSNMCPPEKEHRKRIPKEEQMLIAFSSASCSSESVPVPLNETQEKQVQCKMEREMRNLKLDDSAYTDDINLPAQSVLQIDHVYPACIMHTDGLTLWVITEDYNEIFDFLTQMTNFYKKHSVELNMKDILSLTYCAYYDDDSKCYYRALIIRIEEDMAEVFLADTGEVRATPLHTIQPLHQRFCNTPPYARCCHLAGIDQNFQSKEAGEQEAFINDHYIGTRCKIKIDDNCSESLGVYVILPSGETLNDLLVQKGYAHAHKIEAVGGPSRPRADLDDAAFNVDGPEFENPVEAVTGYRNRDEMDNKGEPDKMCFKGTRFKKRHVMMHPDKSEAVAGPSRPRADLDDAVVNIDGPEFEDPVEAVTGYRNRDEMDICMHYKGEPDKMCFKGTRCKKRHVMMHPDKIEAVGGPSRPRADLDDAAFNIDGPEFEDPVEAVTGYRNRDEMDICMHYKGEPDKMCFKGTRCKKRHVVMHPDGWTLDRVPVTARLPDLPLPAPGTWLRVIVSHVASHDTLYLQFLPEDESEIEISPPSFGVVVPPQTLAALVQDMNSPATLTAYKPCTMIPAPGELVAAVYPPDEHWYRARVLSVSRADQNVEVLFVDYGNILWVREDRVRMLEERWCGLAAQAARAKLAGVRVTSPTPPRLAAARDAFAAVALERKLDARVIARGYDEITVELFDAKGYTVAEKLLTNPIFQPKEYMVENESFIQKIVVP